MNDEAVSRLLTDSAREFQQHSYEGQRLNADVKIGSVHHALGIARGSGQIGPFDNRSAVVVGGKFRPTV